MVALFKDFEVSHVDFNLNLSIWGDFNFVFMVVKEHHTDVINAVFHEMSGFLENVLVVSSSRCFPRVIGELSAVDLKRVWVHDSYS